MPKINLQEIRYILTEPAPDENWEIVQMNKHCLQKKYICVLSYVERSAILSWILVILLSFMSQQVAEMGRT